MAAHCILSHESLPYPTLYSACGTFNVFNISKINSPAPNHDIVTLKYSTTNFS